MISDKLLVEEFNFIGVEGLEDEIIIKCQEIAAKYKIDAERFVEEWIAFAQTNLNGNLKPTTVTLDTMERKQLSKNVSKNAVEKIKDEESTSVIKVYNNGNTTDVNNILDAYNLGTSKKSQQSISNENTQTTFSPATLNPEVVKPSTVYKERKDQGEIVERFGAREYLDQDSQKLAKFTDVNVTFLSKELWSRYPCNVYMFESPFIDANVSIDHTDYLGTLMKKKYFPNIGNNNENTIIRYGRIRCDGERLNAQSVLLETTDQTGKAQLVQVNLSNIPKYALFPGQVIMLEAKEYNVDKKPVLMASKLYCDVSPEFPVQVPVFPPNVGPLKMVVASGPYTLSDNLAYQPLQDLIKYVVKHRPDVLILIGPFVDIRHSSVASGLMAETYKNHFKNLIEKVTTPLQDTNIQIVIVSSALDAHHCSNVFPTQPFESLPEMSNVHMVSNPAMIDVNGIVVGVSSADVLFHLAKTELNCQPENMDRMARFAEHVIAQRCFYPILPAQSTAPGQCRLPLNLLSLNYQRDFDVKPHILILPSNLRRFVKNVKGCIVVNPERLTKGYVGGTFACLNIYPGQTQQSVADHITCRIINI